MRMTLIDPEMRNLELIKEGVGPFLFYKHFGYKVSFVCYENGSYPYLDSLVKGIDLKFIDRPQNQQETTNRFLRKILGNSVVAFLKKNSQMIDVLHLIGFSKETLIYAYVYKLYNKKGICYVRCDTDYGIVYIDYIKNPIKRNSLKYFFNKVDFYSVESTPVLNALSGKYPNVLKGLINFPVPCFFLPPDRVDNDVKKEKIILTVARLGSHQKNTELLLRAFSRLQKEDWSLALVGPLEEQSFNEELLSILKKSPELEPRILLIGEISNREELFKWYQKSSIFCLPSRHESFGIALLEPSYFGCFPITTGIKEIPAAYDITKNWEYGAQFSNENEDDLLKVLEKVTSSDFDFERIRIAKEISLYIKNTFMGKEVIQKIHDLFMKKIKNKEV